jgi:hypothetical protein
MEDFVRIGFTNARKIFAECIFVFDALSNFIKLILWAKVFNFGVLPGFISFIVGCVLVLSQVHIELDLVFGLASV